MTAILLCLCMALALLPVTVSAADEETIFVGGVELLGSTGAPVYAMTQGGRVISGGNEDNYNIKWDGSTLTLNGAELTEGFYELEP